MTENASASEDEELQHLGPSRSRPHKSRRARQSKVSTDVGQDSSLPHIWLFLASLAAGTAIMALTDSAVLHFVSGLGFTALFAVVGYFAKWHLGGGKRSPRISENFIDSCYYLGFIFTQIALVVSFWKAWQSQSFTTDKLVPLIATALGASVVGLLAKIVFDQIVPDNSRLTEETNIALKRAVETFVKSSAEMSSAMDGEIQRMAQSARMASATVNSANVFESSAVRSQESLAGALRELEGEVSKLKTAMNEAGRGAAEGLGGLSSDLRAAVSCIAELKRVSTQIAGLSEAAASSLIQTRDAYQTIGEVGRTANSRVNRDLDELQRQLAGLSDRIGEEVTTSISSSISGLEHRLRDAESSLERIIREFTSTLERIEREVR